jgi:hypothetical protein
MKSSQFSKSDKESVDEPFPSILSVKAFFETSFHGKHLMRVVNMKLIQLRSMYPLDTQRNDIRFHIALWILEEAIELLQLERMRRTDTLADSTDVTEAFDLLSLLVIYLHCEPSDRNDEFIQWVYKTDNRSTHPLKDMSHRMNKLYGMLTYIQRRFNLSLSNDKEQS